TTDIQYDSLDRPTCIGFGRSGTNNDCTQTGNHESRIGYTFDLIDRLTQGADSTNGTINLGYNDLGDVTSESTPFGPITFTYDNAGRRQTRTAPDQADVMYCYDEADRLLKIVNPSEGCSTFFPFTQIDYDGAGRPA